MAMMQRPHSSSAKIKRFVFNMTCIFVLSQGRHIDAFLKSTFSRPQRCWTIQSTNFRSIVVLSPSTSRFSSSTTTPDDTSSDTFSSSISSSSDDQDDDNVNNKLFTIPWNNCLSATERNEKIAVRRKFRQHVNPLALRYQQPTILSEHWPKDVFQDTSLPLILDIGCGKGGFLLELAQHYATTTAAATDNNNSTYPQPSQHPYNYLGLEIRPPVARFAQSRIVKYGLTGHLDYVGCNANVDLERLLQLYHRDSTTINGYCDNPTLFQTSKLHLVTIQFPDPHFKSSQAKRRVVTPALVQTLCRYMPPATNVFLQSDVQVVLDEMRLSFRQHGTPYLQDVLPDLDQYMPDNILGVPTERERSVLERNLPVYRAVFQRTATPVIV